MRRRRHNVQPYAWVILTAASMSAAFAFGGAKAFGVFYVEFLEKYGEGSGSTAWIASVSMSLMLGCGIFCSWLCEIFSARVVMVTGGVIAAIGHVISSYVTRMEWLYLTYGVITGIGRGMCFTPSLLMVNTYFVEHRAFANGIFAAGSGVGSFALPFITRLLLDNYGLDGALLVFTGITLNLCVCGVLMRPFRSKTPLGNLRFDTRQRRKGLNVSRESLKAFLGGETQPNDIFVDVNKRYLGEVSGETSVDMVSDNTLNEPTNRVSDTTHYTFVDMVSDDSLNESVDMISITNCLEKDDFDPGRETLEQSTATKQSTGKQSCISEEEEQVTMALVEPEAASNTYTDTEQELLDMAFVEFEETVNNASDDTTKNTLKKNSVIGEKLFSTEDPVNDFKKEEHDTNHTRSCSNICIRNSAKTDAVTEHFKTSNEILKVDINSQKTDLIHPTHSNMNGDLLLKDDNLTLSETEGAVLALKNNDLENQFQLTEYMSSNAVASRRDLKNIAVTRNADVLESYNVLPENPALLPNSFDLTKPDVQTNNSQGCIPSWCKHLKKPRFDVSIIKYPIFLIYEAAFLLMTTGYLTHFIMLPAHAVHIGFTKPQADLLLSIVGIADIFGRAIFGWFSDLGVLSREKLSALMAFLGAISSLLIPLSQNYAVLCVYSAGVGLLPGAGSVIAFVLVTESIGTRMNPNVIGVHSSLFAIPALIGPPIAGWLKDWTGSWDMSFRVVGICLLASMTISLWVGPILVRVVKRRQQGR